MAVVPNSGTGLSPLFKLPPPTWGLITSFLDARSIVIFMRSSPRVQNLLRSPHAVPRLHIDLPYASKMRLTEWPFEWFDAYPTLVSVGLALNIDSKMKPFTYASLNLATCLYCLILTKIAVPLLYDQLLANLDKPTVSKPSNDFLVLLGTYI